MKKRDLVNDESKNEISDKQRLAFQVLVEEYKSCRTEVLQRMQMCHQFSISGYLVLGAIFAFVFHQGIENDSELRSMLLLFPLPLFFLGLSFQHTTRNVYLNARYINSNLRSELMKITGNANILAWEDFLAKVKPEGAFFRLKDEDILYLLSPMALVILILLVKIKISTLLDVCLVCLNLAMFVLSLWSRQYTSKGYSDIENKND